MCNFFRGLPAVVLWASLAACAQTADPGARPPTRSQPEQLADPAGFIGNRACAACHASIYDSYVKTSMAHASGPSIENLIPADFSHKKSGVHYRIYAEDEKVWLSYERPGDPGVRGQRELLYYIGSGRRGRSYLFATGGFLFESPVNWYSDRHLWDMAPAYGDAAQMPLTLPAYTSCLHCHFSGLKAPEPGTENRYPVPPFTGVGVTCEACHGPGAEHAKAGAAYSKTIVNPAKLDATRRDDICMSCHLEGKAAIERAGRHIYDFRPGQQLSDSIRYFVYADQQASGLGAVSQFEALAQSACKKKSGAAMTCTSCHDPHSEPAPAERVSYYRQKCLACHGGKFEASHHPSQPDCTACHMPASLSTDVAHTEVTDHRIARRPILAPQLLQDANGVAGVKLPRLVPFPETFSNEDGGRELALAWESITDRGMSLAAPQAERQLRAAVEASPKDSALLAALGYAVQKRGDLEQARELYRKALAADPTLIDAATNLGVIEARSGRVSEAVKLWQDAFRRAPGQSRIGMNLARVLCPSGQPAAAREYVLRVLQFNPDLSEARTLMQRLNGDPPGCGK